MIKEHKEKALKEHTSDEDLFKIKNFKLSSFLIRILKIKTTNNKIAALRHLKIKHDQFGTNSKIIACSELK